MPSGLSSSRLRSKTADGSDITRGLSLKQTGREKLELPPLPPIQPISESGTPTKPRRRLPTFLGLKRKNGIAATDSDHVSGIEYTREPEELNTSDVSPSRTPITSRTSLGISPLPSDSSPSPLDAAFQTPIKPRTSTGQDSSTRTRTSTATDGLKIDDEHSSSSKLRAFRTLRFQKSSFEMTSRPTAQDQVAREPSKTSPPETPGKKTRQPVITISGPPRSEGMNDANVPSASKRTSTMSQSTPSKSGGHFMRFGFGLKKDDAKHDTRTLKEKISAPIAVQDRPAFSRANSLSPPTAIPPTTQFSTLSSSVPKKSYESTVAPSSSLLEVSILKNNRDHFEVGSPDKSSTSLSSSFLSGSPSSADTRTLSPLAAAGTPSDGEIQSDTDLLNLRTRTPTRPPRPTSLILPNPVDSRPRTAPPPRQTPSESSTGRPPNLRLRTRTGASPRSSSPASPPPSSPLPSPPTSATFPSETEAESTDASTRFTSVYTMGSIASRKSGATRARASTITGSATHIPLPCGWTSSSGLSSGEESRRGVNYADRLRGRQANGGGADISRCMSNVVHVQLPGHSRDKRSPGKPAPLGELPPLPPQAQTPSQRPQDFVLSDGSPRSPKDYVRILNEKHASEKAELTKRIERLEREARKRERELRGMRVLIMNSRCESCGATMQPSAIPSGSEGQLGRLRSGSQVSATGSDGSRSAPSTRRRGTMTRHSPTGSTEEGLLELQKSFSDFIQPSREPSEGEGMHEEESVMPQGEPSPQLRRSNTMPEGASPMVKQSRRTSSPEPSIPSTRPSISSGLGFDIPSVPSSQSSVSGSLTEYIAPPLTANSSTASSLSAIPEVGSLVVQEETDDEKERHEKMEKRSSKVLKRISTSSLAASLYANNLKVSMSPSIGQVLDRSVETDMDLALQKLKAFNSSSTPP